MAGLPHWDNSRAATNYYEPLFLNQFEVVITPPAIISANVDLLVEHVVSISGLPELTPTGVVEQKYKFASRSFAGAVPEKTTADLDIKFTVNLNEENDMYIYNILRGWADLAYDPLTGRQGLKRDYYGQIYVANFNKAGDIFRQIKAPVVFPTTPITPIESDFTNNDIYRITGFTLRADYWEETIL